MALYELKLKHSYFFIQNLWIYSPKDAKKSITTVVNMNLNIFASKQTGPVSIFFFLSGFEEAQDSLATASVHLFKAQGVSAVFSLD